VGGEFGRAARTAACREIGRARGTEKAGGAELACDQGAVGKASDPQGEVDALGRKIGIAILEQQFHAEPRVAAQELGKPRCEVTQAEAQRRAHPQFAARFLPVGRDLLFEPGERVEQRAGIEDESPACLGRHETATVAGEEHDSERFLEMAQPLAHRRLGKAELLRGAGKATAVGDGYESAQCRELVQRRPTLRSRGGTGCSPLAKGGKCTVTARITIALAQIDTVVGDLEGNLERMRHWRREAAERGARLVVFPELALCGYPPEDLVLKVALTDYVRHLAARFAAETADGGPAVVLGAPWREAGWAKPRNVALLLDEGRIRARIDKHALPNYGVFDELRVFDPGPVPGPVRLRIDGGDVRLGIMICEDMWVEDVAEGLVESGAELLLVINGSPYEVDKQEIRIQHAVARVTETGLPLLYVNQIGGQDELVFDGASFALDAGRHLFAHARSFEEQLLLCHLERGADECWRPAGEHELHRPPEQLESIYRALMLGLRDYVDKNRFPGVVLGLSGGIDSALSATVAVDALGAERVRALMMPSRYTSRSSLEDAEEVARRLGIRLDEISIEPAFDAFLHMLEPLFGDLPPDVTEENIQARIRGVLLMAVSNKFHPMVLSTGNKSEMSVGYATLYGDMCGGFSVLKDVYKTTVFELARFRNRRTPEGARGPRSAPIPERILTKPPSAELRPGQKDEDALPPYAVLDPILKGLIEEDLSPPELVARGFDAETVRRVQVLLDSAEYKRRQAPPGVKITPRAFGRDRRYPITNAFRRTGIVQLDSRD